jgi:hypothetical protein
LAALQFLSSNLVVLLYGLFVASLLTFINKIPTYREYGVCRASTDNIGDFYDILVLLKP